MSLISKLFGGGKTSEPEPVEYSGFEIFAEPMAEGGKYRLSARIEKIIDGERKTCAVVRADVFDSREQADSLSIAKAKQVIDEQGDSILASGSGYV